MKEREVAVVVAREAGALLREGFGQAHRVMLKSTAIDPVTKMDRVAEQLIVSRLQTAFPDYGVLSEEGAGEERTGRMYWLIDPLDGTTNYAHGYPFFAVSIALLREEQVVLGVVYNPVLDELYVAERGHGATMNGRPLRVSETAELIRALVASGCPYDVHDRPEPYLRLWRALLTRTQALRQDGAASLDLCYVAAGRLDAYVERGLEPWDVAAGSLIVQEAGGVVTDFSGGDAFVQKGEILAANPYLYSRFRALIGRHADA